MAPAFDRMPILVFWISLGLLVYHQVGYPLAIRLCLALWPPRQEPNPAESGKDELPSVTVIVPAHNEAAVIAAKIRNLAALHYPEDRLTCVVALDGCTDATRPLAEAAIDEVRPRPVLLIEHQPNIGKVAVLNDHIGKAQSDIVALTDASASVDPDALLKGAARFRDPSVGVVTGRYSITHAGGEGETAYWQYQSDVRSKESALAGPMGAHGAFYLFRRAAWSPLPGDTINDDFVLPMTIVASGYRAIMEPAITAVELERTKSGQNFWRRVRIGAGNLQQVIRLARLADPRRGWVSFAFLSGKGLRGVLPFLLAALVVAILWGAWQGRPGFLALIVFGILAAAAVLVCAALPVGRRQWFRAGLYVLEGYAAISLGALLLVLGQENKVWRLSKSFGRKASPEIGQGREPG